jgi:hypothetical protein
LPVLRPCNSRHWKSSQRRQSSSLAKLFCRESFIDCTYLQLRRKYRILGRAR